MLARAILTALLLSAAALSQQSAPSPLRVTLRALVTDHYQDAIPGLTRDDFRVFEKGKEQPLLDFQVDDSPISVVVLFDVSGSISSRAPKLHDAFQEFFCNSNPENEYLLILFSDVAKQATDFTSDWSALSQPITAVKPRGKTALNDAMYLGLSKFREARHPRHILLLFSDGFGNIELFRKGDVLELFEENSAELYMLGGDEIGIDATGREAEPLVKLRFRDFFEKRGGRYVPTIYERKTPEQAAALARALRHQYLLTYESPDPRLDGKWRKVTLKVRMPKKWWAIDVSSPAGYFASPSRLTASSPAPP